MAGTSYAVTKLSKNSVGSKQIKKGGVKNSDIADNAVTSSKVKDERNNGLSPNSQDGATVECPRGTSVAGGGVSSNVLFAGGWGEMINTSAPLDSGDDRDRRPDDGWEAVVDLFRNVPVGARIDVYAICLN